MYESLADQIDARAFDQETLNGYILNAYSALAKPQGELTGALNAMTAAIEGRPQDEILTYIRYARKKGCQMTGPEDMTIARLNVVK